MKECRLIRFSNLITISFVFRYLKAKQSNNDADSRKRKHDDDDSDASDVESVASVEFDEYLDNLMEGNKGVKAFDFAEEIEVTKRNKGSRKEGMFCFVFSLLRARMLRITLP